MFLSKQFLHKASAMGSRSRLALGARGCTMTTPAGSQRMFANKIDGGNQVEMAQEQER